MTPTTLYSDKHLFVSMYKNALNRLKGMGIIYAIISFLTYPMFFTMETLRDFVNQSYSNGSVYDIYTPMSILFYFPIIVVGAVIMSVYVNNFMHSKKAVDVFHALPVKRHHALLANYAAVATVMLLSQILCYSTVFIVNAFTVDYPAIFIVTETLRVALLTLLMISISFLCCVCCNSSLDSFIFSGAFMSIIPLYALLCGLMMESYVYGFSFNGTYIYKFLKTSPAIMLYQVFSGGELSQGLLLNAMYIIATVAFIALACRLYPRRKSERAQSGNTRSPLYQFILLAASVGGGAFFGFVYSSIFGYSVHRLSKLIIVCCVFTVAIYLVFNAIISRNPKPTRRGLAGLAVSIALTTAFLICADNGFFGFESYVPSTGSIKSVTINYVGEYDNINGVEYQDEDGNVIFRHNVNSNVTLTEKEDIEIVKNIHRTIVDSIDKSGIHVVHRNITLTYILDNGMRVERRYYRDVPVEAIRQFGNLEDSQNFKAQLYPVLYAEADKVDKFNIRDGFARKEQTIKLSDSDKELLYNAIAKDTLNITRQMKDQRMGVPLARIEVLYHPYTKYMNEIKVAQTVESAEVVVADKVYAEPQTNINNNPIFDEVYFDVYPDCINTIEALKQIGYGEYTELALPEDMKVYVEKVYYPIYDSSNEIYWRLNQYNDHDVFTNMQYAQKENVTSYTEYDKITAIADVCKVSVNASQVKSLYTVIFVNSDIHIEEYNPGDVAFVAYYVSGNDVPDFVEEDITVDDVILDFGYINN